MQLFSKGKIYDFMAMHIPALVVSTILVAASVFLLVTKGFNYGIDFSGGTLVQLRYDTAPSIPDIRAKIEGVEAMNGASVTEFGSNEDIVIRYSGSSESLGESPADFVKEVLADTGNFEVMRVDIVGAKVGGDLRKGGVMALSISIVLILIYIALRFELRFAIAAVIGEIHDILIVIGVIVLLRIDVNLDTLAALLTILGYALNDTIIVFDRIREGIKESKFNDITHIINESVSHTLPRTIMTAFTTLITVIVMFGWGGDMIHDFSFIMMVGIIVGTYSSIFVAAQCLILLKFDVAKYRANLIEKEKRAKEKEKIRHMYEKGVV